MSSKKEEHKILLVIDGVRLNNFFKFIFERIKFLILFSPIIAQQKRINKKIKAFTVFVKVLIFYMHFLLSLIYPLF